MVENPVGAGPDEDSGRLDPQHLEVVKKGKDAIAEWREEHPEGTLNLRQADLQAANLAEARLQGSNLTRAHLTLANLTGAHLTQANLAGARLQGSNLAEARLQGSNLTGAYLTQANLTAARLQGSDLSGAHLMEANLTEARLHHANLTAARLQHANLDGADLRGAKGYILDECRVHRTRFVPRPRDPWSVLRYTYTGPRLILTLLLLLAFLAPRIGQAMFWMGVKETQDRLEQIRSFVLSRLHERRAQFVGGEPRFQEDLAQFLSEDQSAAHAALALIRCRVDEAVSVLGADGAERLIFELETHPDFDNPEKWQERSIVGLLVSMHRGWFYMALAILLLTYNAARGVVMWFVAPMRDAEERSHVTPAYKSYRWLYRIHRFLVSPLFYVAVLAILVHLGDVLRTTVLVPV